MIVMLFLPEFFTRLPYAPGCSGEFFQPIKEVIDATATNKRVGEKTRITRISRFAGFPN
jgi:hypothetical protein